MDGNWLEMVKRSGTFHRMYTVGTTEVLIAQRNLKRIGLFITGLKVSEGRIHVGPHDIDLSSWGHVLVEMRTGTAESALTSNPLFLTLKDHGDLVRQDWGALSSNLAGFVTVMEVVADGN